MKTLTLNIGLNTNDGSPAIKLHWAFTLLNNRFEVIDSRVDISPNGGETTIIAVVQKLPDLVDKIHDYCLFAKQDCIAIFDGENGELIGPNAAKWGQFNSEFFVPFEPKITGEFAIEDYTAPSFCAYLEEQIIPDSREAGFEGYARDLEIAAGFIRHFHHY